MPMQTPQNKNNVSTLAQPRKKNRIQKKGISLGTNTENPFQSALILPNQNYFQNALQNNQSNSPLTNTLDSTPIQRKCNPCNTSNLLQPKVIQRTSDSNTIIQRDEESEEGLSPEVEALLNQIGIRETEEAPPMTAIVAATGAELSSGTLEEDIERLWRRQRIPFVQAARMAASRDYSASRDSDEAHAMASPDVSPEQGYALKWALSMYAYDYQTNRDIPEIQRLLYQGSPFQQSLAADTDHIIRVRNPTANDITTQIGEAIWALALALPENQIGELVVHFSGHGGEGGILGVDGESVSRDTLTSYAQLASEQSVHITYVIDACLTGDLVQTAITQASNRLAPSLRDLPEETIRPQYDAYRVLHTQSTQLGRTSTDLIYASRAARRSRATDDQRRWFQNSLDRMRTQLESLATSLASVQTDLIPDFFTIQLYQRLLTTLFGQELESNPRRVLRIMHMMGSLLDTINESTLAIYTDIERLIEEHQQTSAE